MSVTDLKQIDMIGLDDVRNVVSLGVSDDLPWGAETLDDHLLVLQEKLNAYLRFIESGEIYTAYPQAMGRFLEIEILMKTPPPAPAELFLTQAREVIGGAGVSLKWRIVAKGA